MRKLFSFIVGIGLGATVGVVVVMLFSPVSGQEFIARLQQHYQEALEAGRKAASERRNELEAELARLQSSS